MATGGYDTENSEQTNEMSKSRLIFKIVSQTAWIEAEKNGLFEGAAIDLQDGYIHFSTAEQAVQTAALHFKGQDDLLLVAVSTDVLGEDLVFEPSRGGDLFPHLYGKLNTADIAWAKPLPLGEDGKHIFPDMAIA